MEIPGYRLEEKIGEGGMSEVYRAEQLSLKRTVAIKFLSEQLLHHPTAQDLFEHEPLIVARLNHPKIIHVIDKGITENGKPYFVMEYVEGITLHDLVQEKSISNSEKIQYLIQICRGLSYAHRNGIVHRDIKPANIIIDQENNARILDFGIASFYTDDRFIQKSHTQVLGTERYMAPEVKASSANASILSDIYSLGVLMFEVFGENFVDPCTPQNVQKAEIPAPVKRIILNCIHPRAAQRPTSTSVIENQLLSIIKGAHLAASQKANAEKDIASLSKKFALLDVLNENDYGAVYLYEKNDTNDLIVIKKRSFDASGLKEAKLLATLKHENIINIHGTASNRRSFIVVMDYMSGGSLSDRLMQPFNLDSFFPIADALLDALSFAHQNRIFHGNIRPSNILFDSQDKVKLSDFGMTEHYHCFEDQTNWYLPQKEEPISAALDIFSLGAVFYHMLTGEPLQWKNGQIAWTEAYARQPKPVQEFLLKMLALAPDYRFASALAAKNSLKQLKNKPKSQLKPQNPFAPKGLKQKAKQGVSLLKILNNIFWILLLALAITYSQIYFFFPEIKLFIHQTLRDFLLWWAEQLKPPGY
jgi:serine/threonine-protein kinase